MAGVKIKHTGRPIKALSCLMACWIIGRVLVDNHAVEIPTPSLNFIGYTHASELISPTLPVLKNITSSQTVVVSRSPKAPLSGDNATNATNATEAKIEKQDKRKKGPDFDRGSLTALVPVVDLSPVQYTGLIAPEAIQTQPLMASTRYFKIPSRYPRLGQKNDSPWSGYFWIFARESKRTESPAQSSRGKKAAFPNRQDLSYGGSQAGTILSYRLIGNQQNGLFTYGRVSAAIGSRDRTFAQEELALGVKVKPWDKIPISVHAEQRLVVENNQKSSHAIYFVGGSGPMTIFEKVQLETYGQAGYVFAKHNMVFFDGFATVQRPVVEAGQTKLALGLGLWSGGQKKIARVDVGPRADVRIPVGTGVARIMVDWRQKVAGNAEPNSGLAVTIAAGF